MTYCIGIMLDTGLVFASDTFTPNVALVSRDSALYYLVLLENSYHYHAANRS
jgi:hypothetical protein